MGADRSRPESGRRGAAALAVLLAVVLLPAACGKKGPPSPPPSRAPAAGEDLRVFQRGLQLILEMAYPRSTVGGLALGDLTALEVWELERLPTPAGEPPPVELREFAAAAERRLTLQGAELGAAIAGDRLVLRLPLEPGELDPPTARLLALRTVAAPGQTSPFSNVVAIVPREPPAPPTDLAVTPGPDGVELLWDYDPATELAGFRVYRREARARFYGGALAAVPATERIHRDDSARFGQRYIYTVTAVAREEPLLESAFAAEREIDYQDRFPPMPPQNLVALSEPGRVRLVWEASPARDVTGYVVERQRDSGEVERLTPEPVTAAEFIDRGVSSGTYRYRVRAHDAAGNVSEPSATVEVRLDPRSPSAP